MNRVHLVLTDVNYQHVIETNACHVMLDLIVTDQDWTSRVDHVQRATYVEKDQLRKPRMIQLISVALKENTVSMEQLPVNFVLKEQCEVLKEPLSSLIVLHVNQASFVTKLACMKHLENAILDITVPKVLQ